MGYRGSRAQLEARLAVLPGELAEMHERLSVECHKVEALREQEWGRLGVLWFRYTLRRALRDTGARAVAKPRGTLGWLTSEVGRHERALVRSAAALRWLEESLVREEPKQDEPKPIQKDPSAAVTWARGALAVVGADARAVWSAIGPLLMVLGVVLGVVAMIFAAFSGEDIDDDIDFDEPRREQTFPSPEEQHASDITLGALLVGVACLLAVGAAVGGAWWMGWIA